MLLTGFLIQQIFIVVLFTSKDFTATVFRVGEKSCPTKPTSKPQKLIKVDLEYHF